MLSSAAEAEAQVFEPAQSSSLADKAHHVIEDLIVTAQLAPGEAVSLAMLSARIGIGRMPVREALKRLAEAGLVTILPQRGVLVSPIDAGQYLLMLETRRVLDALIAQAAARRAGLVERRIFLSQAEEMAEAAVARDLDRFMAIDRAFDRLAEAASKNPFAVRATTPLHAHGRRFWSVHREDHDLACSAAGHIGVMRAIAAGDAVAARTASNALVDYLESFANAVIHRR
jgi:DNA-binding GntR family transcriptional regulator